jgi:hypothetical protein
MTMTQASNTYDVSLTKVGLLGFPRAEACAVGSAPDGFSLECRPIRILHFDVENNAGILFISSDTDKLRHLGSGNVPQRGAKVRRSWASSGIVFSLTKSTKFEVEIESHFGVDRGGVL